MWVQKKGYSKKVLFTNDNWGIQIQLAKIGENEKVHFHKQKTEYFLVLKGKGLATINDQQRIVNPGSILVIRPNQVHHLKPTTKEIMVFMVKIKSSPDDTFFVKD